MCLILKKGEDKRSVKTAVEDICCYKILRIGVDVGFKSKYFGLKQIEYHFKKYTTFYQRSPIKIGGIYKSSLYVTWYLDQFLGTSGYCVEEGLHSFVSFDDCLRKYKFIKNVDNSLDICIVKATIPKGSKYYEGKFECYDSYASDVLKYEKEL